MNAIDTLLKLRGPASASPSEPIGIAGGDPFFRTPFRVAETLAAVLAATGVAANDLREMRGETRLPIRVDAAHAAALTRMPDYTALLAPDGSVSPQPMSAAFQHMMALTQPWPTRDGRHLLAHFNLPHLAERVLSVLRCADTPQAVAQAIAGWDAAALEDAIAEARACGATVRSAEEWRAHPQGRALADAPPVLLERFGDAPPLPTPTPAGAERPLAGLRVLDLTRILAGPLAGRGLAELGADVLMVTAPHLPQVPEHVRDTSHGKRSCLLDLREQADRHRLAALVRQADVFIDGYRPGELTRRGFGLAELAALRPGLAVVDISCFGAEGPLAGRAGWEQIAQCQTGLAELQGRLAGNGSPALLPAPICDYLTGFLACYGAVAALGRRAREGGTWRVGASLCQSASFLLEQGLLPDFEQAPGLLHDAPTSEQDCHLGRLRTLPPALQMGPERLPWPRPTPRLGSAAAEFLPR